MESVLLNAEHAKAKIGVRIEVSRKRCIEILMVIGISLLNSSKNVGKRSRPDDSRRLKKRDLCPTVDSVEACLVPAEELRLRGPVG